MLAVYQSTTTPAQEGHQHIDIASLQQTSGPPGVENPLFLTPIFLLLPWVQTTRNGNAGLLVGLAEPRADPCKPLEVLLQVSVVSQSMGIVPERLECGHYDHVDATKSDEVKQHSL